MNELSHLLFGQHEVAGVDACPSAGTHHRAGRHHDAHTADTGQDIDVEVLAGMSEVELLHQLLPALSLEMLRGILNRPGTSTCSGQHAAGTQAVAHAGVGNEWKRRRA